MGQVDIETLQCLTQHLALGLGKQLMGLTFKALKAFLRHRAPSTACAKLGQASCTPAP